MNSTTEHTIDQDNCLACQEERQAPKPVENGELDMIDVALCISAQHGIHITDKERKQFYDGFRHTQAYRECYEAIQDRIAQEKAKWVAEVERTVIGAKPDRLQPLDLGELGGEDGRTGLSAVVVASVQLYNQAVKDYETNLRQALAKLLDKENTK